MEHKDAKQLTDAMFSVINQWRLWKEEHDPTMQSCCAWTDNLWDALETLDNVERELVQKYGGGNGR